MAAAAAAVVVVAVSSSRLLAVTVALAVLGNSTRSTVLGVVDAAVVFQLPLVIIRESAFKLPFSESNKLFYCRF